jgi:hypothetical protein
MLFRKFETRGLARGAGSAEGAHGTPNDPNRAGQSGRFNNNQEEVP